MATARVNDRRQMQLQRVARQGPDFRLCRACSGVDYQPGQPAAVASLAGWDTMRACGMRPSFDDWERQQSLPSRLHSGACALMRLSPRSGLIWRGCQWRGCHFAARVPAR